jgi:hypothetical protein
MHCAHSDCPKNLKWCSMYSVRTRNCMPQLDFTWIISVRSHWLMIVVCWYNSCVAWLLSLTYCCWRSPLVLSEQAEPGPQPSSEEQKDIANIWIEFTWLLFARITRWLTSCIIDCCLNTHTVTYWHGYILLVIILTHRTRNMNINGSTGKGLLVHSRDEREEVDERRPSHAIGSAAASSIHWRRSHHSCPRAQHPPRGMTPLVTGCRRRRCS